MDGYVDRRKPEPVGSGYPHNRQAFHPGPCRGDIGTGRWPRGASEPWWYARHLCGDEMAGRAYADLSSIG